jgi:hypothetical protein
MSANPNQSYATPINPLFALAGSGGATGPTGPAGPSVVAGIETFATGATGTQLVTVGITGCVSTSVVVATYCHPGAGAAAQAFNSITPGANQVIFDLAANTGAGESINWIARL